MEKLFIKETIVYDGTQLSSHWAYRNFGILGDSIVSFRGAGKVNLTEMVDLKDVLDNAPIFSENMLHFIIEHFDLDLEKTIMRQRLLIAILKDIISEKAAGPLHRYGDDLFWDNQKLTVSIATLSPVSTMIHTGINITGENAPVPAIGLAEIGFDPEGIEAVAKSLCSQYIKELHQIKIARCKVRGVK